MKRLSPAILTIILAVLLLGAEEQKPLKPSPKDKCPVCGMFVAKYPDWLTRVLFKDGSRAYFDGAKDMFKYLLNLPKYNPAKKPGDIAGITVTDYYDMAPIDGRDAFYVTGSDVYGPMGRELIPFKKEADAAVFMKDHKGRALFKFRDVTAGVLEGLD
jgi:nitrous oxide reductase accessory protein NosL